jgi:hypothetical protein
MGSNRAITAQGIGIDKRQSVASYRFKHMEGIYGIAGGVAAPRVPGRDTGSRKKSFIESKESRLTMVHLCTYN